MFRRLYTQILTTKCSHGTSTTIKLYYSYTSTKKIPLCPSVIHTPPRPISALNGCLSSQVCFFPEAIRVELLSLSMMHLRFSTQMVSGVCSFLVAVLPYMNVSWFVNSFTDCKTMGCFQIWSLLIKPLQISLIGFCVIIKFSFLLDKFLGLGLLDGMVTCVFHLIRNCQTVLQRAIAFYNPTSSMGESSCSYTFGIVSSVDLTIPQICTMSP